MGKKNKSSGSLEVVGGFLGSLLKLCVDQTSRENKLVHEVIDVPIPSFVKRDDRKKRKQSPGIQRVDQTSTASVERPL